MSTPVEVHIVHAFTDGDAGGNPAAVVLDADALDASQRLALASRIGLSETAFVSRSDSETIRLEFFTPTRQIAHCGHATVATFGLLRQLGRIGDGNHSKETIDGRREVIADGDWIWMEQRMPRYEDLPATSMLAARVAASLGLKQAPPISFVDTGNRFAVIELLDTRALAAIKPDLPAIDAISQARDLIGYYLYTRRGVPAGRDATTRMFAPRYGIAEEAATGMAAGPLACLLYRDHRAGLEQVFEQGRYMATPSPSELRVRLECDDAGIVRLFAGGRARRVRSDFVEVAADASAA